MKFKKVTALCKAKGMFYIWNDVSDTGVLIGQWMGTGGAMYALDVQPTMSEEALCAILGITAKQRENMFFSEGPVPQSCDISDAYAGESILAIGKLAINWKGNELIPLYTSRGIKFIQAEYLEPLGDAEDDVLALYERIDETGAMTIVAKIGLFVAAVIAPFDVLNDNAFVQNIDRLAKACRRSAIEREA